MKVTTALTVYGIETLHPLHTVPPCGLQQCLPFTVLKLIEESDTVVSGFNLVATALTVYGIHRRVQYGRFSYL